MEAAVWHCVWRASRRGWGQEDGGACGDIRAWEGYRLSDDAILCSYIFRTFDEAHRGGVAHGERIRIRRVIQQCACSQRGERAAGKPDGDRERRNLQQARDNEFS